MSIDMQSLKNSIAALGSSKKITRSNSFTMSTTINVVYNTTLRSTIIASGTVLGSFTVPNSSTSSSLAIVDYTASFLDAASVIVTCTNSITSSADMRVAWKLGLYRSNNEFICNIGNVAETVYINGRSSSFGGDVTTTRAMTLNKTANEVVVGPIANGEALQIRTMSDLGITSNSDVRFTKLQFQLPYFITVFEN